MAKTPPGVKKISSEEQMPIDFAIFGGHLEVVKYLIEVCEVWRWLTQIEIAIVGKKLDITKYLRKHLLLQDTLQMLIVAGKNETSGEILFYFGKTIDLVRLSKHYYSYDMKDYIDKIFKKHKLSDAYQFIVGYQEQKNSPFPYETLLSEETTALVKAFIDNPEIGY